MTVSLSEKVPRNCTSNCIPKNTYSICKSLYNYNSLYIYLYMEIIYMEYIYGIYMEILIVYNILFNII